MKRILKLIGSRAAAALMTTFGVMAFLLFMLSTPWFICIPAFFISVIAVIIPLTDHWITVFDDIQKDS